MDKRIVILALECDATNALINSFPKEYSLSGIIYEQPISKSLLIKNRIKKCGFLNVLGQLLFMTIVPPVLKRTSRKRIKKILAENNIDISPVNKRDVIHVDSANSDECIQLLKSLEPDLVILSGTRIISKKTLTEVNAIFINIHAGITPLYRGVHGAYWALAEGKPELCGVTLHYVDKGIDTGKIIEQGIIHPLKEDNFCTYPYLQLSVGVSLLQQNLQDILLSNTKQATLLTNDSKLRYHPTLFQYLRGFFLKGVK